MTNENQTNQFETPNIKLEQPEEKKDIKVENKENQSQEVKKKKQKDSEINGIKIIDSPVRTLPSLINEVLEKNFNVILTKNGYYIEGFYGLAHDINKVGYAFCQETTNQNTLMFFDSKGHKHAIKSFEDLVNFNSLIWGVFYKVSEDYKKPNPKWFGYMLEVGALNITPGGR
jgi:hypothetical protein